MPHASVSALLSTGKDVDLLAHLKRRDPEALVALFDSYGVVLYSLINRIVGDPAIAEDLLAETLVEVWNRSVALTYNHSALGLWIFSLARNRSIEYVRNPKERLLRPSSKSLRTVENPRLFDSFEIDTDHLLQLRRMQVAFGALEEDERSMLELAFFFGFSTSEIASTSRQPLWNVDQRIKAAVDTIRNAANEASNSIT